MECGREEGEEAEEVVVVCISIVEGSATVCICHVHAYNETYMERRGGRQKKLF